MASALEGTRMRYVAAIIAFACCMKGVAVAGTLTEAEAESLRADVAALTAAAENGEAEVLIARIHPSAYTLAGGPDAFASITRQSLKQLLQSGVKFVSSEVGDPTETYPAGEEEICFVPRTAIMELEGKRMRAVTFMIAIRQIGGTDWKYLDGGGVSNYPHVFYQLFPKLQPGITFPPYSVEAL
jgi:hypothetical protein